MKEDDQRDAGQKYDRVNRVDRGIQLIGPHAASVPSASVLGNRLEGGQVMDSFPQEGQ
jgi:hypothetical protein